MVSIKRKDNKIGTLSLLSKVTKLPSKLENVLGKKKYLKSLQKHRLEENILEETGCTKNLSFF